MEQVAQIAELNDLLAILRKTPAILVYGARRLAWSSRACATAAGWQSPLAQRRRIENTPTPAERHADSNQRRTCGGGKSTGWLKSRSITGQQAYAAGADLL